MASSFDPGLRPAVAAPVSPAEAARRSLARRERERRLWVARSFTTLIVLGLVVLGLILYRRDRAIRARYLGSLEQYVAVLNERLDWQREQGWDPVLLPAEWDVSQLQPRPEAPFDFYRYYDESLRQFAQRRKEPTIIAWSEAAVPMTLSADGRPVAVYQDGRVRVEWLPERQFNERFDRQQEQLEEAIRRAEGQPVNVK